MRPAVMAVTAVSVVVATAVIPLDWLAAELEVRADKIEDALASVTGSVVPPAMPCTVTTFADAVPADPQVSRRRERALRAVQLLMNESR